MTPVNAGSANPDVPISPWWAWGVFFGGFACAQALDFLLRTDFLLLTVRSGSHHGLAQPVWFGLPLLLAAIAVPLAFHATRPLGRLWLRLVVTVCQQMLGFVLYVFLGLWYVVGTGIDFL